MTLFVSIRGWRLTQQSISEMVKRCAVGARLATGRISPHTLRHTFATTLLTNGENLQTIRVLMNHKNLSTTARYLHTQDQQLNAAVNGISLKASLQGIKEQAVTMFPRFCLLQPTCGADGVGADHGGGNVARAMHSCTVRIARQRRSNGLRIPTPVCLAVCR